MRSQAITNTVANAKVLNAYWQALSKFCRIVGPYATNIENQWKTGKISAILILVPQIGLDGETLAPFTRLKLKTWFGSVNVGGWFGVLVAKMDGFTFQRKGSAKQ